MVGIDPRLDRLPSPVLDASRRLYGHWWEGAANALLRFGRGVVEAVAPFAVAVKLQIAFYEMYGWWGLEAYSQIAAYARELGLMVIGDVKRGDIASTAEAYAAAHLGEVVLPGGEKTAGLFNVDAITINPYLGSDGVLPFVRQAVQHGRGVFVLVRTSNPSAGELQDLTVQPPDSAARPPGLPARPRAVRLWEQVAALVRQWGELAGTPGGEVDDAGVRRAGAGTGGQALNRGSGEQPFGPVGAVVGATYPEDLARARELLPNQWILVPGYGTQGATARDAVQACCPGTRLGALVNAGRSIIYAFSDPRWMEDRKPSQWAKAVAAAARHARDELLAAADTRHA